MSSLGIKNETHLSALGGCEKSWPHYPHAGARVQQRIGRGVEQTRIHFSGYAAVKVQSNGRDRKFDNHKGHEDTQRICVSKEVAEELRNERQEP
jgi:hypothetical protein